MRQSDEEREEHITELLQIILELWEDHDNRQPTYVIEKHPELKDAKRFIEQFVYTYRDTKYRGTVGDSIDYLSPELAREGLEAYLEYTNTNASAVATYAAEMARYRARYLQTWRCVRSGGDKPSAERTKDFLTAWKLREWWVGRDLEVTYKMLEDKLVEIREQTPSGEEPPHFWYRVTGELRAEGLVHTTMRFDEFARSSGLFDIHREHSSTDTVTSFDRERIEAALNRLVMHFCPYGWVASLLEAEPPVEESTPGSAMDPFRNPSGGAGDEPTRDSTVDPPEDPPSDPADDEGDQ